MRSARVQLLIDLLYLDPEWRDPNPTRSRVSPMGHALRCALRARRHQVDDHEMIAAALLHDAARPYSDVFHGEVMAAMLRDVVRPNVARALEVHGAFQDALLHEKPLPEGPHEATLLAMWDFSSFNEQEFVPPLETFALSVERLFTS